MSRQELLKVGRSIDLNSRDRLIVAGRKHVVRQHTKPSAFEMPRDARRSGENIDERATSDATSLQKVLNLGKELRLISDQSHRVRVPRSSP